MTRLYRKISHPGGVTINIHDLTRIYYGDFFLVKLEIECKIPTFESAPTAAPVTPAAEMPRNYSTYSRYLEKMGVPSTEVEAVKLALVTDFETNSLPYILSAAFPAKLFASRQQKVQKPVKTYLEKNSVNA